MFANTYAGRKVLVTGHTGFKGSWLCAWLLGLGSKVCGFSKGIPTTPANFEALELKSRLLDLRGDIRDLNQVRAVIRDNEPEMVFHLAAQALVRESYDDPVGTFETNMMGTLNVLEAVRACPSVKAVVVITSDKCYRNEEWVWGYRETDRLGGYDPYSASKGCAEIIAHSYFQSYFEDGAGCATARAGNVIGGGDWAKDRIVPDCARAWVSGKAVELRNPNATRPWQHVLEPLSGYLWLGARLMDTRAGGKDPYNPRGESYNFGPAADANHSVGEVARDLALHWPGFQRTMDEMRECGKKECGLLKLCCDKALAQLDWKATLNFEETIRYTAEWYARYYADASRADMWTFTQGQIAAYVNAASERGILWANT